MKNLLYIVANYGHHLLFLVLEIVAIYLIVNYNQVQNEIFINSTNILTSRVNNRIDRVANYLSLEDINDSLQVQNAKLLQRVLNINEVNFSSRDSMQIDSQQYELIPSKLCNGTFKLKNNYLTLCTGSSEGVEVGMGVISLNGVMGQITAVSDHFSKVMSILHSQSKISAYVNGSNAYGSIKWDGFDPRIVSLEGIPTHIHLAVGDTIATSGFSTVFPKDIMIGVIKDFEKKNIDYAIDVELANDPTKIDVIYIVVNEWAKEQVALEKTSDF